MTSPLEITDLFRASFPLRRYFQHKSSGTELLFGDDCFLLNRKYEIPCSAIPDIVTCHQRTPLGLSVTPCDFRVVNLLLGKSIAGGDCIPASRVGESQGRVFFENAARLYELCFIGHAAYPAPEFRFVSESPAEIDHWLSAKHGPDTVVLDSGIAVRLEGESLEIFQQDKPHVRRVIENALPAGTRLYSDGEKVLILDGNVLKAVKTKKE